MLKQLEQGDSLVCLHFADQGGVTLVHDQVQGRVTEHREPQEGEHGRHQHHAKNELANGAPTADLGDKQPDKGRPGDGPAEDEQGPVTDPVTVRVGLQVEGTLDDVVQIAAGILQEGLEDKDRRANQKHEQHQRHRQHHVEDGEVLDPLVQAGDHREQRQTGDHRNGDDLHVAGHRNAGPEVVQPRIDLRNRQPQGGGDTEQGAENGDHVHGVPDGAVNALTNQRIEGRAHRQRQAVAKGKVGQYQADQPVDRPDMKAPMKEGNLHRLLGGVQRLRGACGRAGKVGDRFGHAKEQQGDAVAGGKQHGEPGREAVLRLRVIGAEANIAPAAAGHQHHE